MNICGQTDTSHNCLLVIQENSFNEMPISFKGIPQLSGFQLVGNFFGRGHPDDRGPTVSLKNISILHYH